MPPSHRPPITVTPKVQRLVDAALRYDAEYVRLRARSEEAAAKRRDAITALGDMGMPATQAAELLGISPSAVAQQRHRRRVLAKEAEPTPAAS